LSNRRKKIRNKETQTCVKKRKQTEKKKDKIIRLQKKYSASPFGRLGKVGNKLFRVEHACTTDDKAHAWGSAVELSDVTGLLIRDTTNVKYDHILKKGNL